MAFDFNAVQEDGPQPAALAVFAVLMSLRADWGGQLILCCGLGNPGTAIAQAANAAGAACLSIEPDRAVCRAAMRAGACDFLVNTVDEALRVLKNEIRKRQPLSVALELETEGALRELMERGVQPQLFAAERGIPAVLAAAKPFAAEGAKIVSFGTPLCDSSVDAAGKFEQILKGQKFMFQTMYHSAPADIRELAAFLLTVLTEGDPRRKWIKSAARLFHRDRPYRRALLWTAEERAAFEAVRSNRMVMADSVRPQGGTCGTP